ncbi:unnamed protein product [Cyprideis torosa]|uniref:Uncharacterized protein n=1 Tax=Cyprideis torosa TaxID=163714 RepID=A0A7R8WEP6_9CRUS|nr:unnamed protein product [Cyprideis torosa]CAG0890969.1 unnamed protein product [Cyprideis torosa]
MAVAQLTLQEVNGEFDSDAGIAVMVQEHTNAVSAGSLFHETVITANTLRHDLVTRAFEDENLKDLGEDVYRVMCHKKENAYLKYLQVMEKQIVDKTAGKCLASKNLDSSFVLPDDDNDDNPAAVFSREEPNDLGDRRQSSVSPSHREKSTDYGKFTEA